MENNAVIQIDQARLAEGLSTLPQSYRTAYDVIEKKIKDDNITAKEASRRLGISIQPYYDACKKLRDRGFLPPVLHPRQRRAYTFKAKKEDNGPKLLNLLMPESNEQTIVFKCTPQKLAKLVTVLVNAL